MFNLYILLQSYIKQTEMPKFPFHKNFTFDYYECTAMHSPLIIKVLPNPII
jgi:hypothetical protein